MGLVQAVAADPEAAALAYFEQHLAPKSAAALACALAAARGAIHCRRAPPPRRSRATLSRPPHAHARRQRRARRIPRQTPTAMGAPLMPTIPPLFQIVERCQALFEDLELNAVKQWKAAAAGPQGDRLHAGLRAARARPRGRHAVGRHSRRRRPARSDPGRRVLPELHLPDSALDHRARRSPAASTASTACCSRRSAT